MKILKNILVAVDFSESSENLLVNSIKFAKKFKSDITLIHVLPNDIGNDKVRVMVEKGAIAQLNEVNERINNEGIKTGNPILEFGSYYDRIVDASDKINANMVIVGSGESSKKGEYRLGTTAEKIIRESNKPVFVINNHQSLDIRNIICPVDFSEESSRALKTAIMISRLFSAKLVILSVYTLFRQSFTKLDPTEINEQRKSDHLEEFNKYIEEFNLVDVDYSIEILGGDPAKKILKAVNKHNSDLLLMGTTGKSGISKMLMGSVTEKVIREVMCSFITLKHEDAITLELESKIQDLENQYATAVELVEKGFFEEAINQYKKCLSINYAHIPSLNGIATVYEKLGDEENANKYKGMVKDISDQIWNLKNEKELDMQSKA
ncbi:universal stress protein [Portibacter lacus]|uniref:UspA domain-containing protein n=1 Tax=Portibacter lacus TaxID=1099794 RepID=A0AA37WES0_9BACT|nr:universal stress protein [Portibacter lacus]GLR17667.1 hypothetical protein GCM10007940_22820 [Portibacter lacus]